MPCVFVDSLPMRTVLSLLLIGLAVPSAFAQTAPGDTANPSSQDIVVTARKAPGKTEALQFVNRISARSDMQLAKFIDPVCPLAIGFPKPIVAEIEARIRAVATEAGVHVDAPGCSGNIVLIAIVDSRELVTQIRRQKPQLLFGLSSDEIRRLVERPGPVRSWTVTAVANEDGQRFVPDESRSAPQSMIVRSASIINPQTQQVIDSAVVAIDVAALVGKTATQVADYAAMRLLAKTRPVAAGDAPLDTILGLFDSASPLPGQLSDSDLAYLKALYRMPGNRSGQYQAARIAETVVKSGHVGR